MKTWLKILLTIVVVLLIIQLPFFRPKINHLDAHPENDIGLKYDMPMYVMMSLNDACYDCHSNYTSYVKIDEGSDDADSLWYNNIQPISWWINLHIKKGKEALNFSEFAQLSPEEALKKFEAIEKVMEEKTMPLKSYLWQHDEGKLSDEQYKEVVDWAKEMQERIRHPEKFEGNNGNDDGNFMGFDDDFDEEAYIKALEEAAEKGTELNWED